MFVSRCRVAQRDAAQETLQGTVCLFHSMLGAESFVHDFLACIDHRYEILYAEALGVQGFSTRKELATLQRKDLQRLLCKVKVGHQNRILAAVKLLRGRFSCRSLAEFNSEYLQQLPMLNWLPNHN